MDQKTASEKARELLEPFRGIVGASALKRAICLPAERADELEQAICDALLEAAFEEYEYEIR